MIKNPNWQEATSWLFTKRGRVESGTTGNKCKQETRTRFEPGASIHYFFCQLCEFEIFRQKKHGDKFLYSRHLSAVQCIEPARRKFYVHDHGSCESNPWAKFWAGLQRYVYSNIPYCIPKYQQKPQQIYNTATRHVMR